MSGGHDDVAHAVGFFGAASSNEDGPSPLQALLLTTVASEALARALEKLDQAAHAVPAPMQPATASLVIVNTFSATEGVLNLFSTRPFDAGAHPAPPCDARPDRPVAGGSP